MFTQELRHETEQVVRIGVFYLLVPGNQILPIYGVLLNGFQWRHLIKPNGILIDIVNHEWNDIPQCTGLYYLTLTVSDTNIRGPLTLYIHQSNYLGKPILMHFMVIDKNVYDSKYENSLLKVEPQAQKG